MFTPYLNFNGDCAEAFAFYARVLGGEVTDSYRFADMPPMETEGAPPLSDADQQKVMHARLVVRGHELMGADMLPGFCADGTGYRQPQGMSVSITADSVAEGERIFNALAEGGTVGMPFAPTFFSQGFGLLTDRFGIPWMIDVGHPPA
ncbi:PhnB protein [Neisseria sp. HSC-16F19]|nr:VOC family protein [Neisseria sp. HSC-16F19]MCP2041298.1 PhnB protein [Neisseria sp. HSC-16F19]